MTNVSSLAPHESYASERTMREDLRGGTDDYGLVLAVSILGTSIK